MSVILIRCRDIAALIAPPPPPATAASRPASAHRRRSMHHAAVLRPLDGQQTGDRACLLTSTVSRPHKHGLSADKQTRACLLTSTVSRPCLSVCRPTRSADRADRACLHGPCQSALDGQHRPVRRPSDASHKSDPWPLVRDGRSQSQAGARGAAAAVPPRTSDRGPAADVQLCSMICPLPE
jgi:hypothetical protein